MRRFRSKSRNQERKIIQNAVQEKITPVIETAEPTLRKLLTGQCYDKVDMEVHAKLFLLKYGHDHVQQFVLLDDIKNFDSAFQNIKIKPEKPIFVIFSKTKNRWILFCVIQDQETKNRILYKDPRGTLVPFRLEKKLLEMFPQMEFIAQTQNDLTDAEDECHYGPLTLRNLKITLDFLTKPLKNYQSFRTITFSNHRDLRDHKFSKIISLTNELGQTNEFKVAFRKFIDNLPMEWSDGISEYREVMEAELEKGEEEADIAKIQEARKKYLSSEKIKEFQQNYQLVKTKDEEDYKLEIQKKFPDEMKKLLDIFEFLENLKVNEQLFAALRNISAILEIDYKKIKSFYKTKPKFEAIGKKQNETLHSDDIGDISEDLSGVGQFPVPNCSGCTPLRRLLSEITLGMDGTEQSTEEIEAIEAKYDLVKTKYEKWKNSDVLAINSWAKQVKGHLDTTDATICETIAIMDRAFNLESKKGFRLRDTQILATLIFFHDGQNQGRLCQIQTGEGKTIIVSLIAVIRVLQGLKVDVITSNALLAEDGVNERKTFYSIFDLTVATNHTSNVSKIGYDADVLYGTISTFQFDYLKDSFEGFNVRKGRVFGQVILDEVDSMLIDNGGHIAKLASPFPGMETLRYIYIKIWQELHRAEEDFVVETQKEVQEFIKGSHGRTKDEIDRFYHGKIISARRNIKERIKKSKPIDIPLLPVHLKEYAAKKLDTWIRNALHAKYNCREHQQYRIIVDDSGEEIVTPVDYLNTGVTMKNTIWSNGLHQFVQLKHNLYLTFESLTSCFISNIGYIKKYHDRNIFGLTGTLGSRAEQELLSQVYNVNYAKLPTFKTKKFQEIPGLILDDSSWYDEITLEILKTIDESRAVLVICETGQDLLTIKENLRILHKKQVRVYANEDDAQETKDKVKIGDIILATNIAGRGTNFKTDKSLEANGGLHVCVGFLPCNQRVEAQAFGRTSRQGNSGTSQLIIRRSEIEELGITGTNPDFTKVKVERDGFERNRLEEIKNVLVKELNFKDELFALFSEFHQKQKAKHEPDFVVRDLKEFWAFWLEKENFDLKKMEVTTPSEEFGRFLGEARRIVDGEINHNPFYSVALGDYYLDRDRKKEAEMALKRAIELGGEENYELLAGAHLKLFELAMLNGGQVMERFRKALAKVFFISVDGNVTYKSKGIEELIHAKRAIEKEIRYVETYLTLEKPLFCKIVQKEENSFLKHLMSRVTCLKVHHANIEALVRTIIENPGGIDIDGKATTSVENFGKINSDLQLSDSEISELQLIGIDAIYSLRQVHDVPDYVIHSAQGQILGGIAALTAGICFPPIFTAMSSIAGTLISEGIMDIVTEVLLNQGNSEPSVKEFVKNKCISYGISLITFGISAITQSIKILTKAINLCRMLSSFLRKSTRLRTFCNNLAKIVDKIGKKLENMLTRVKFNKLSKVKQLDELTKFQKSGHLEMFDQLGGLNKLTELQNLEKLGKLRELKRIELLGSFIKTSGASTGKKVMETIIQERVFKPLLSLAFQKIIAKIRNFMKETLKKKIESRESLMRKLRTTPNEDIVEAVASFLRIDEAIEITKEVGIELSGIFNNTVVDALVVALNFIESTTKLGLYIDRFVPHLKTHIHGGDNENNVDDVVEEICIAFTDQILTLSCDIFDSVKKAGVIGGKWYKKKKKAIKVATNQQNPKTEDPYEILGLPSDASDEDIQKQYRRMALLMHPDKNPKDPEAIKKIQKLQDAYDRIKARKEKGPDPIIPARKQNPDSDDEDPYKVLGLEANASASEIRKKYLELAQQQHPDKNRGDPEATKKFQKLQDAYDRIKARKEKGPDPIIPARKQNPDSDDEDPYKVLGLEANASASEIRKKYLELAQQQHPDRNRGDPEATKKFQKIQDAYDRLKAREDLRYPSKNVVLALKPGISISEAEGRIQGLLEAQMATPSRTEALKRAAKKILKYLYPKFNTIKSIVTTESESKKMAISCRKIPVKPDASPEIKTRMREMLRRILHPDRDPDEEKVEELFKAYLRNEYIVSCHKLKSIAEDSHDFLELRINAAASEMREFLEKMVLEVYPGRGRDDLLVEGKIRELCAAYGNIVENP